MLSALKDLAVASMLMGNINTSIPEPKKSYKTADMGSKWFNKRKKRMKMQKASRKNNR